ncbi:MAG TPA: methyl-accepting chemotaxis protein [Thermodesulfobacteriota bacterium]
MGILSRIDIKSVRSRFLGSYAVLAALFFIQIPIIYFLVSSMSRNYAQVESAGELRKRAIEINYVLDRHILNGEDELEAVFQARKAEFGDIINALKSGDKDIHGVAGSAAVEKLGSLEAKWGLMSKALDEAMESGEELSSTMVELEDTTYPMMEKIDASVRNADLSGTLKSRTASLSYLMERYARSNYDKEDLRERISDAVRDTGAAIERLGAAGGISELWDRRKALVSKGMETKDRFEKQMNELADVFTPQVVGACDELSKEITKAARSGAAKGIASMAVMLFLSIGLGVFFMWVSNEHLLKPLMRINDALKGLSAGDLTKRAGIRIRFLGKEIDDEVVALGKSVDSMADNVSEVIGRISESSTLLASASEELSASASHISAGAGRQSAQTAQVATAMEEMNATVMEVARNSQQVSESAREAQNIAIDGGKVVEQAIKAMQDVSESTAFTAETIKALGKNSEEIGTIVSVINDIADQTNLLALNAAIEAARAGEQGRGFAVVADEVRKLAERTTRATKEISEMINTIQAGTGKAVEAMSEGIEKVDNGVRLANRAGDALKQIVTGVENVTGRITHIATSAEEQSSTADDIARNMESIAEVAKTNVRSTSEVTGATDEMARLAAELQEIVARFRLSGARAGEGENRARESAQSGRSGLKAAGCRA